MFPQVFVRTFGCQMNEYDSAKMYDVLHAEFASQKAANIEDANIILVNTCSVREKAAEKLYSLLGELRLLKNENPQLMIGVGGCVATQEGEEILKRAPYVDVIFGPQTLHRLPSMLREAKAKQKAIIDVSFPEIEKFDHLPEPRAEGPTAYVSIMEGCSKYCTYCIVPYTRGEEISRPFDDILAEVVALAEQGVREVTFLGQNVNDYLGQRHCGDKADLALLIHYVAEIEGIERIRFTTSHPTAFSDSLINAYAEIPKLANHLHLPVQSGSNRILGMMKRGYTVEHYEESMAKLRAVRPDISITTDIIVGFPTETDEDFAATLALVKRMNFDQSFSFIYSQRPGTPAALLVDNISFEVKKARLAVLQTQLTAQAKIHSEKMLGSQQKILITGPSKKNSLEYAGRTENNRVVNFDLPPRFSQNPAQAQKLIGQMLDVTITELRTNSLRGKLHLLSS